MKNNEFRIGNFVNYLGDNYQVVEIGLIGILGTSKEGQFSSKIDNPHLQPIELTEELALKLGFKRFESDGVVGFDTYEPEEKTIWYEIGKFTLVQWGENTEFYFSDNNLRIPVKYVHQLQNLYFALTGVELELSST